MNYEEQGVGVIADWIRSLDGAPGVNIGRGGIFCVELRDRSPHGMALRPGILQMIWQSVHRTFGGTTGLGFIGPQRAFLTAADEDTWSSLAACVVEAAVGQGLAAHDLGVGIGFARLEEKGQIAADVLRLATTAASRASDTGIGFAARTLSDEARDGRRLTIEASLDRALSGEDGLRLVFQPMVDANTRAIVGAEALLRFQCPDVGEVSTMELIGVAEAAGKLEALDRWSLGLAVESLQSFHSVGIGELPISVNVRASTAFARGFVDFVAGALATFGIAPDRLQLEIREDEILQNMAKAEVLTQALAQLGVKVAIDGFGRGKCTLNELGRLRVSTLKLDRGVVREMMSNQRVGRMAHGMMHLARVLQMQTVAVGIETDEQHEHMRKAGCQTLQGFLFYKPLEAEMLLCQFAARASTLCAI